MTHPEHVKASPDLIKEHVQLVLDAERRWNEKRLQYAAELERAGYRLVSGGQVSRERWEIRDWRSNELIAAGDDGIGGYDAALARLDPNGTWFNSDRLYDEDVPAVSTPGIPPSLSQAIADAWLGDTSTADEEIAQFIDWPVEKVRECRDKS